MMQIFLIKFLLEFDLISKLYGLNLTNLSVEIFIADSFCDCLLSRPIWGVWIEIRSCAGRAWAFVSANR